jgi:hypothetical protein
MRREFSSCDFQIGPVASKIMLLLLLFSLPTLCESIKLGPRT